MIQGFNLAEPRGALIGSVELNSPAAHAVTYWVIETREFLPVDQDDALRTLGHIVRRGPREPGGGHEHALGRVRRIDRPGEVPEVAFTHGGARSIFLGLKIHLIQPERVFPDRAVDASVTHPPRHPASRGVAPAGEGEWAAAKHGGRGRRGWRKLHLGVDGSRGIVACALTEPTADDAITGISLVDEVDGHLTRVTADPAYDTRACYGAAGARGARVVVPPTKTASLSRRGTRSGARDRTIRRVKALGRRRWKKASGSHQHARVENAFFRYKSIVGDCLRARSSSGQRREAVLACNVLNRMTELGRPVSYRIGR